LRPGFDQIPGVRGVDGYTIMEWREVSPDAADWWRSLLEVKGIGPRHGEDREFAESDDPFKIKSLDNMIKAVKKDLPKLGLPSRRTRQSKSRTSVRRMT
jgi:hypothetical protein